MFDMNENPQCDEKMIISLFFDSGTIKDVFYGGIVFEAILNGGELQRNAHKVIVSLGDVFEDSYKDISPYLIIDKFCTIDVSNRINYTNFKDWPFCWIIEDIEYSIAVQLDKRLKHCLSHTYKGMTRIDTQSTDIKKQFWKELIRDFSIDKNTVTVFQHEEYGFSYIELCDKLNLNVKFDDIEEFASSNFSDSRASSFVKKHDDLKILNGKNGVDREINEMSFSLVKEVSIAGVFIWKAIEDIEKIYLPEDDFFPYITDHLFISLYQASQGVERLQKIIVELILYKNKIPYSEHKKLEELLMSHNHIALSNWILKKIETTKTPSLFNELLLLLKDFYNSVRYSRFSRNADPKMEVTIFRHFGSKCSSTKEVGQDNIKHLYGKALGQATHFYYELIKTISSDLGIYTYEISSTSPAYIVFMFLHPKNDLYESYRRITNSKREVLWWLVKNSDPSKFEKHFGEFLSLDFDPAMIPDYLEEILLNRSGSSELFDTVDVLYDELFELDKESAKNRLSIIEAIMANTNVSFDIDEELDITEEE